MKVAAPGKLLLSGAYAVLDGAPAVVVAVDRRAVADGGRRAMSPSPEVLAALSPEEAPEVDATALRQDGQKLGLGSSAAMLVASMGIVWGGQGRDLSATEVRDALFLEARRAHASVQGGGSGVDIAASVYGGALEYSLVEDSARALPLRLPAALVIDVFWCGKPAVTTQMRGRVDALRARDAGRYDKRIEEIASASRTSIAACHDDDLEAFVVGARRGAAALAALGHAADAPIFPPRTEELARLADEGSGAFLPSGAGGGDVFVHLARAEASSSFVQAAASLGLHRLAVGRDHRGVHVMS